MDNLRMDNLRVIENSDSIVYDKLLSNYKLENHQTNNIMTKYEKANILGVRMEQLAFGSKSTLDDDMIAKLKNVKEIAREELKQKKIPFMICRTLPDKTEEFWRIDDLIIP
jgi:DNA-directed RNA polymerase subunit K/omega|tara:strand:+ start:10873 stop:11205 length:333 start_codon:yes stop_codon:yes gene_type:complete